MPNYYKAVPKRFLQGIRETGLDPSKAGQAGGVTAKAIATGRRPTELDSNYTWLARRSKAQDYAQDHLAGRNPVIIKVVLDTGFGITDHGTSGFGTALLIPPQYIFFQSAKGSHREPISAFNGDNAFIFEEELSADESSDDE